MDVVLKHFYEYVTKFLENHIEDSNYGIITLDSIGIFLNCLIFVVNACSESIGAIYCSTLTECEFEFFVNVFVMPPPGVI